MCLVVTIFVLFVETQNVHLKFLSKNARHFRLHYVKRPWGSGGGGTGLEQNMTLGQVPPRSCVYKLVYEKEAGPTLFSDCDRMSLPKLSVSCWSNLSFLIFLRACT